MGADTRVASDILAGVSASYSSGTFDFTDKTGAAPVEGTYATAMTSVNPYVAWFQGDRGNAAWGTYGLGWGDIEIEDEREDLRTSPGPDDDGRGGRQLSAAGERLRRRAPLHERPRGPDGGGPRQTSHFGPRQLRGMGLRRHDPA